MALSLLLLPCIKSFTLERIMGATIPTPIFTPMRVAMLAPGSGAITILISVP